MRPPVLQNVPKPGCSGKFVSGSPKRPSLCRASHHSDSEKAVEVVSSILTSSRDGAYGQMLEHLPDSLIDLTLKRMREYSDAQPEDLELMDCLKYGRVLENGAEGAELRLSPQALRALVFQGTASSSPLSNIRLSKDTFLRRVSVETFSGERMTLTFTLKLEESLVARYKGVRIEQRWVLREVRGENEQTGDEVEGPTPTVGPEVVVEAQLKGLREADFNRVFAFASPQNKAVTGPIEKFAQMIVYSPQFKMMVGHERHEIVKSIQPNSEQHFAVVKLFYRDVAGTASAPLQSCAFLWMLRMQHDDEFEGCWLTEGVQPLGEIEM